MPDFSMKFVENFENVDKISEEHWAKCIILAYFSKGLTNHALPFCTFGLQTQFLGNFEKTCKNGKKNFFKNCENGIILACEILRKFSKICNIFLRKLIKCIILAFSQKIINKTCVRFWRVWTKSTMHCNFWKGFSNILKRFLKTIAYLYYFSIFIKKSNKPRLPFCAFGREMQTRNYETSLQDFSEENCQTAFF